MYHLLKPTAAKIKQNHKVIWKGPVQFDGSTAKLDLKTIKGFYCKHTLLTIEFYKKSTNGEWTDNIKGRVKKNVMVRKKYSTNQRAAIQNLICFLCTGMVP